MARCPEASTLSPDSLVTGSLAGDGRLNISLRLWPSPYLPTAQDGVVLGTPDPTNISTVFPDSEHHMEHAMVGSSRRPLQLWVDKCVTSPQQDLQYNLLKHCGCLGDVKDTLPTSCPEMSPRDQSSPSRPSDLLILLMAPMFTPSCWSGIQRYHLIDATRRSVPSTGMQTANRGNFWEILP